MSDCEVIIVNGAMADGKFFDSGCTRDSNRVTSDSVIDYVLASLSILRRLESLRISNPGYSDHNALTLGWYGKTAKQKPKSLPVKSNPTGKFSSGPTGWCFLGSLPEEKNNDFFPSCGRSTSGRDRSGLRRKRLHTFLCGVLFAPAPRIDT